MRSTKGITLISLVVTIVILIILAMVSINLLFDTNLIDRATSAKELNKIESIRERLELAKGSMYLDNTEKSNLDTYFISLNKEKINPYILTKIEKITDKLGIVEVDNKYSFLIKFENNIEIEYEGKIEEIERKDPVIEVTITGLKEQSILPVELTAEVIADGEKVTRGKWILNQESKNIGTDESLYTENTLENGSINLEIQKTGEYFLHILTTDMYGREKETIKGPINVNEKYHIHTGNSSSKEGCYITPVYHSHADSCYITCEGHLVFDKQATASNGTPQGNYHCSACGKGYFYGMPYHTGSAAGQACGKKTFNCSKNDTYIDYYSLGCEKTEETQEGYNITY